MESSAISLEDAVVVQVILPCEHPTIIRRIGYDWIVMLVSIGCLFVHYPSRHHLLNLSPVVPQRAGEVVWHFLSHLPLLLVGNAHHVLFELLYGLLQGEVLWEDDRGDQSLDPIGLEEPPDIHEDLLVEGNPLVDKLSLVIRFQLLIFVVSIQDIPCVIHNLIRCEPIHIGYLLDLSLLIVNRDLVLVWYPLSTRNNARLLIDQLLYLPSMSILFQTALDLLLDGSSILYLTLYLFLLLLLWLQSLLSHLLFPYLLLIWVRKGLLS